MNDLDRVLEWMREPDHAEEFSLAQAIDWMNRRPLGSVISARNQLDKAKSLPLEWRKEALHHSTAAAEDDCEVGTEEWCLHREASRIYKKCANDLDDVIPLTDEYGK